MQIRRVADGEIALLAELGVAAWAPVFASFRNILGPRAYAILYPDWQRQQREVVSRICSAAETVVLVAAADQALLGFLAYTLSHAERVGTVELLAVHPDHQNRGAGTALNRAALEEMRASGMKLAGVSTGSDPGHAPARQAYEKAGYTAMHNIWYYQVL